MTAIKLTLVMLLVTSFVMQPYGDVFAKDIEVLAVESQYDKNQLLDISMRKNIEYSLLASIIPSKRFVPPLYKHKSNRLYLEYFAEKYPLLVEAFNDNRKVFYKEYDINKFDEIPKVYYGYPPYLKPTNQINTVDKKLDVNLLSLLEEKELIEYFSISQEENNAQIYLMPVLSSTYIQVFHPDIKWRLAINARPYSNITRHIENVFFNVDLYTVNKEGMNGALISDAHNNLIASFCPVAIDKSKPEIEKNIVYCLIQSHGLPGFQKEFPHYNKKNIALGAALLKVLHCSLNKSKHNYFDITFDDEFYKQCL